MENQETDERKESRDNGFRAYAVKQIAARVLIGVAVLWALSYVFILFESNPHFRSFKTAVDDYVGYDDLPIEAEQERDYHTEEDHEKGQVDEVTPEKSDHVDTHAAETDPTADRDTALKEPDQTVIHQPEEDKAAHTVSHQEPDQHKGATDRIPGMAFVDAAIVPLDYELNKRFMGWRPNDMITIADNVINYQLGVLEVTRRTAVTLAEEISRTGDTAAFDKDLENARDWLIGIRAERLKLPSAGSKYNAALRKLRDYQKRLETGEANFYARSDTLIPLLKEYQNLLGSCDDNLVKKFENDGRKVKSSRADDYFHRAKGTAKAMEAVLEAVHIDFHEILETRHGSESLHHAIESLHHASELDPWMVTEGDLSGILANHRANMAAHISHARFYLGVLIKTLST